MARSIFRMAQIAVDLFEPKRLARGKILIRKYGLTDTMLEVNETRAMANLVNFVVFQVIGKRIDKVGHHVEVSLQDEIYLCCKNAWAIDWYNRYVLIYEVWYASRSIIRLFLGHVSQK